MESWRDGAVGWRFEPGCEGGHPPREGLRANFRMPKYPPQRSAEGGWSTGAFKIAWVSVN